jgi:predicted amidohydrolase
MKCAAAAYPLDPLTRFADFDAKITAWVAEAADGGAEIAIFPEYGAMELAHLAGPSVAADLEGSLRAVSDIWPEADALFSRLAVQHGLALLAPSAPIFDQDYGLRPVNRACIYGAQGRIGHQDKQIMTRFEREIWHVQSGGPLQVFDLGDLRVGVLICYDAEFPLLARALVEAGVDLLLVPSCTDSGAGYWRVRVGAMARALEGQCAVLQSPTVGQAAWSPAVDENHGAAAIYGPAEAGFCDNGVFAEGAMNKPGWVMADIDLGRLRDLRQNGTVLTRRDWPESATRTALVPQVKDLP